MVGHAGNSEYKIEEIVPFPQLERNTGFLSFK
jgi:hypothetical protein